MTDPDGKKLTTADYTLRYTSDAAGEHELTKTSQVNVGDDVYVFVEAKDTSSYRGHLDRSYHIYRYDLNKLAVTVAPKEYTGYAVTLDKSDLTWKAAGKPAEDVTYEFDDTYTNNVNKGAASVTVTGTGECVGTRKISYAVGAKNLRWWWEKYVLGY